jgi:2-(1,2-epoxy-1,2-dihydrophenyl)acetyl-CoA isomerase
MTLSYEVDDAVAILTLNRPEVLNAFNDELGFALLDAVNKASDDESIRCVVITGAGRAFCSGEDLGALADGYKAGAVPDLGKTLTDRYNPTIKALRDAPKPVIAAVNGVAAGAGASLALACDFRIASDKAKFVLAFIKAGLVPDSGALWFLARTVGYSTAWQLAATGEPMSAEDANNCGIVHRLVEAGEFEKAWRDWATELAAGPTRGFALTKELLNSALDKTLEEQLEKEVRGQSEAGRTSDHMEGVRAFLEKRPPDFTGR